MQGVTLPIRYDSRCPTSRLQSVSRIDKELPPHDAIESRNVCTIQRPDRYRLCPTNRKGFHRAPTGAERIGRCRERRGSSVASSHVDASQIADHATEAARLVVALHPFESSYHCSAVLNYFLLPAKDSLSSSPS